MPDAPTPANGPAIVREPPGFLDNLIDARLMAEVDLRAHERAAQACRDRLKGIDQAIRSAMDAASLTIAYDPGTRRMIQVYRTDAGRSYEVTLTPCGLSTTVCLPRPVADSPAASPTDGRRDEGPAIEGEAEAEGSTDSLIATREAIRRAGGSDWDKVGDPEAFLDRKAEGFEILEVHPGGPTLEELAGDDDASTWKPLRGPSIVADRSSPRRPVP
jgi:hypothetical protein